MAAPTYATDLSDITTAETVTGWSALGGGASGLNDETDYFIQGNQCVSKNGFTATTKGQMFNAGTTTITSGDCVFIWIKQNNRNLMDTVALGGTQVCMGSGTSAFDQFYVDGNDSDGSALAGWRTYCVDPTATPSATTGSPGAYTYFGAQWKILGSGSLKGAPNGIDVIRHGRELTCVNGDLGNGYATFDGAATFDSNTTRAWGILTPVAGGYQFHGAFVMGTTGTSVDFRDSNRVINVLEDEFAPAGFNEFEIRHASSNVEWTNILISALGTTDPATLTLNVGTFTGIGCQFTDLGTSTFAASGECSSSVWRRCDQITAPGTTLNESQIIECVGAANTSSLVWDVNQDPDGELDNMVFDSTDSTNAVHAIEFGTNVPATMTLRGCTFTGFSATQDVNDSTFHFKDTAGTITLNLVNCTGNAGYRTDGATINIVQDPVTTTVTAIETDGTELQNVLVLLEASNGTGDLPYQDVVTITQTSGTATVSHTGHGLSTNQYVVIRGATQEGYNRRAQITVTDANTYTYSVPSGTASPATGSPVSTGALVYGFTDVNGEVSDTRTLSTNQPVSGWARLGTTPGSLYKTALLSGTVSNTTGGSFTALMISDE